MDKLIRIGNDFHSIYNIKNIIPYFDKGTIIVTYIDGSEKEYKDESNSIFNSLK